MTTRNNNIRRQQSMKAMFLNFDDKNKSNSVYTSAKDFLKNIGEKEIVATRDIVNAEYNFGYQISA